MTETPSGEQGLPSRAARRRRVWARVGGGIAVALALGLVGGILWLGTPTPLVTVMSPSMEPYLDVGDIALMGRQRGAVEIGDVVEVPVPLEIQRSRNYPKAVVHRVIAIEDGMITTQGDNVGDPDPFTTPVAAVQRRLVRVVPAAGRIASFVTSPFGILWLVAGVVFLVGVPAVDRSRERREGEQAETQQTLQHVVAAVADYGYHLQSHTEILKAMSQAAQDLSAVVSRLEAGEAPARPRPPATPQPPRPRRRTPLVAPTRDP